MKNLSSLKNHLQTIAQEEVALSTRRFFHCDESGCSHGTRFIGIRTPQLRKIAKHYFPLSIDEMHHLLLSDIHEERLMALFSLNLHYDKAKEEEQKDLFDFYVAHFDYIRDWDLVDSSAPYIVGKYLLKRDQSILYHWALSSDHWVRRIAIVSTWMFIRSRDFTATLEIASLLIQDKHDLIHKSVGWMLREMGKREKSLLEGFLEKHAHIMPRTMLRYAIEKFPKEQQRVFLAKKPSLQKDVNFPI